MPEADPFISWQAEVGVKTKVCFLLSFRSFETDNLRSAFLSTQELNSDAVFVDLCPPKISRLPPWQQYRIACRNLQMFSKNLGQNQAQIRHQISRLLSSLARYQDIQVEHWWDDLEATRPPWSTNLHNSDVLVETLHLLWRKLKAFQPYGLVVRPSCAHFHAVLT